MRKEIEFIVLGNNYRTKQFSAVDGVKLICEDDKDPLEVLKNTEVLTTDAWVPLTSKDAINSWVKDSLDLIPPSIVLQELCGKVLSLNFDFLKKWKPVSIPSRFLSKTPKVEKSEEIDPVVSMLVIENKATLMELEQYYSTEDAFKMYDMIAIENLNKALGSEAAMNKVKR